RKMFRSLKLRMEFVGVFSCRVNGLAFDDHREVVMKSSGECSGVACSSDVIPNNAALSLTPPTSPKCDNKVLFAMLPEKFLIRVCSSPILDVTDRLNLMLTCKQLRMAASKSWSLVTKLRIANNESDDDRIDDRFVITCIDRSASSLTSITLCLNSSINSQLCKGIQLFQHLRACTNLRELTLLLTQLPLRFLNSGLAHISSLSLRKLALVNSVADATTMRIVANTQGGTLRSLGLINCFHLSDDAFEPIVSNMHLLTLNIRSSRRISAVSVQRVIDAYEHRRQPRQLKLYNYRSSVYRQSVSYVMIRNECCSAMRRSA
uniref:F-box domain-containing protein n=1 Tax=Parascaris univalens TaxID=6257 RepID=A0A915B7M2_PARUN